MLVKIHKLKPSNTSKHIKDIKQKTRTCEKTNQYKLTYYIIRSTLYIIHHHSISIPWISLDYAIWFFKRNWQLNPSPGLRKIGSHAGESTSKDLRRNGGFLDVFHVQFDLLAARLYHVSYDFWKKHGSFWVPYTPKNITPNGIQHYWKNVDQFPVNLFICFASGLPTGADGAEGAEGAEGASSSSSSWSLIAGGFKRNKSYIMHCNDL